MMPIWRKRLAWAACALVVLTAAGWGASKVMKKTFVVHEETVDHGDGIMTGTTVGMTSDDPDFTEEMAKERYEEIQSLIAAGEYELVKVTSGQWGLKTYIYRFTLSSGEEEQYGVGEPLDDPELAKAHQEELTRLIAEGAGEVVEVKRAESGLTVYICRVVLSDGTVKTYGSNVLPKGAK